MLEKIKNLIITNYQKLQSSESYRQIILVSSLLILSRIFGFIRQALLGGSYLGSDVIYSDIFFNAQKIQDTLIAVLIMGTIISTITPTSALVLAKHGEEGLKKYLKLNFWIFLVVYLAISILTAIFIDDILKTLMSKAYNEYASLGLLDTFINSARILTFGVVFFAINSLLQSYLNLKNSFFWNNITGSVINIIIIIALLVSPANFVYPLSIALIIGFVCSTLIHFYASAKLGFKISDLSLKKFFEDYTIYKEYLKSDIKQIVPKFFLIPLVTVASILVSQRGSLGYPTFYETAGLIQGIFLTIVGAVGAVILPKLSKIIANSSNQVFLSEINKYVRKLIPLTIGAVFATIFFSKYVLLIILNASYFIRGNFQLVKYGVREELTVNLIQILSISLIFSAINEILVKYFLVKNQIIRLLAINTFCILGLYLTSNFLSQNFDINSVVAISWSLVIALGMQSLLYYLVIIIDNKQLK